MNKREIAARWILAGIALGVVGYSIVETQDVGIVLTTILVFFVIVNDAIRATWRKP